MIPFSEERYESSLGSSGAREGFDAALEAAAADLAGDMSALMLRMKLKE